MKLNSNFQAEFSGNASKQRKALKKYIKNWNGNGKNLILVTHYVITLEHSDYNGLLQSYVCWRFHASVADLSRIAPDPDIFCQIR